MVVEKRWAADPEKRTILEFINNPVTIAEYDAKRWNRPRAYRYYDTPDGQDIDKKLWLTTKYGLGTGLFFALVDNRMYSNPRGVFETLNRGAFFVLPITAMFTTYAAITYTATNVRGVDDPWNSGLGGAAAGSLVGVWLKDGHRGFHAAFLLGLFCTIKKYAHDLGHTMGDYTKIAPVFGDQASHRRDWSLTPEGERGWTTGR